MDTNTYLIDDVKIEIDNFYIKLELFSVGKDENELNIYEIDIHIGGELWCVGKTKAVGTSFTVAKQKFNEFVNIAKEIKDIFE